MSKIILLNEIYPFVNPPEPQLEKDILFADRPIKEQYWRRNEGIPANWKDLSVRLKNKFIDQEVERSFISGAWIANNGELVYLPPDAYMYFKWCKMKDGHYPKFRFSQLHEFLFERFCEAIPNCIGTYRFKKRRDGLTTRRMFRKVWKAIQPCNSNSWLGMQSKTGPDARDVCWETLMTGYRSLPSFFKPKTSGSSDPKKKLEFREPSTRLTKTNLSTLQNAEDDSLYTTIDFRDTTADAYDGQELLDLSLDEFAKWEKASALRAFTTYNKCVWKDGEKVGHIHSFSSPSQKNGRPHDESIAMWNMGDPERSLANINSVTGTFDVIKKSWFILRYFVSAIDGYGGACDQYGVCDKQKAIEMIKEEIDNTEPELRQEVQRQLPISIDDILMAPDDMIFGAAAEMKARKIYIMSNQYKNEETKEPKYVYANLNWKDGIPDTTVSYTLSKNQQEFSATGKFCFQMFPEAARSNLYIRKKRIGIDHFLPPEDSENVIGVDPYDHRRVSSKGSEGAAVGGAALDFYSTGIKDKLYFSYLWRPRMPEDYYEDMIKACVFLGAYANIESRNKNIIDYFEDRGYFDFLLPKAIHTKNTDIKGNATTTTLIDEISSLLDNYYGDEERLNNIWMDFLLDDHFSFNPDNTQKSHLTMAMGQMLLGFMKRRLTTKKKRLKKPGESNSGSSIITNLYLS